MTMLRRNASSSSKVVVGDASSLAMSCALAGTTAQLCITSRMTCSTVEKIGSMGDRPVTISSATSQALVRVTPDTSNSSMSDSEPLYSIMNTTRYSTTSVRQYRVAVPRKRHRGVKLRGGAKASSSESHVAREASAFVQVLNCR